MIFFDRSIPRSIARALQLVRDDVRWLDDEFSRNTVDRRWLQEVGSREWLVISRDKKIRQRAAERQAILDNQVGCFIIIQGSNSTRWEYLRLIVPLLDRMEDIFATVERPFICGIDKAGNLTRLI